jgi:hypothetical protein
MTKAKFQDGKLKYVELADGSWENIHYDKEGLLSRLEDDQGRLKRYRYIGAHTTTTQTQLDLIKLLLDCRKNCGPATQPVHVSHHHSYLGYSYFDGIAYGRIIGDELRIDIVYAYADSPSTMQVEQWNHVMPVDQIRGMLDTLVCGE